MAHQHTRSRPPADFRHRSQSPRPAVAAGEQQRVALLRPSLLAPRQMARRAPRQPPRGSRMRQRLLPLPVMVAIGVSLVWRRRPAGAEVQRGLARAGVLGVTPMRVRPQALSTRLEVLPAAVRGPLFAAVGARLQPQKAPAVPQPGWAPVRAACSRSALVDGSPLEARRKKTQMVRERQGLVWGGKMRVRGEACNHRPLWPR
jgi:hypothetical protein